MIKIKWQHQKWTGALPSIDLMGFSMRNMHTFGTLALICLSILSNNRPFEWHSWRSNWYLTRSISYQVHSASTRLHTASNSWSTFCLLKLNECTFPSYWNAIRIYPREALKCYSNGIHKQTNKHQSHSCFTIHRK